MIYTVTFNPSLDYIVQVDSFEIGKVNRTNSEVIFPGGKGINVSMVLKNLGIESTALGFIAGFTGDEIAHSLDKKGITTDFIKVENGVSRINAKVRSDKETEINGQGPKISEEDISRLYSKLSEIQAGDYLVLAGSIPSSMPATMYSDIMEYLLEKEVNVVVDATGNLLVNVLKYHPFLIKPNNHELSEIFSVNITSKEDVILYAKKLQEMGATNVLVSMGADGAVLVNANGQVLQSDAPEGKVVNTVGSGDSMVAGFIYGYLQSNDYEKAFQYGLCAGSASAFSMELATKKEIEELMNIATAWSTCSM